MSLALVFDREAVLLCVTIILIDHPGFSRRARCRRSMSCRTTVSDVDDSGVRGLIRSLGASRVDSDGKQQPAREPGRSLLPEIGWVVE